MNVSLPDIDVPAAWEAVDLSVLLGTVLIVGAPSVGKSTLTRFLYARLAAEERQIGVLDGDPGQSTFGPPTTMTLVMGEDAAETFPPQGQRWRHFVGSTSPVGHMLPVVVGAGRLVHAAEKAGAEVILYDTTGLVDPDQGGVYLKLAKIDLLQPTTVIALHGNGELAALLEGLRRSKRLRLIELPPSDAARERSMKERQAYRAQQFERYFEGADTVTLRWSRFAVLPKLHFEQDRLVALEDEAGFVLALGVVEALDPDAREVTLRMPLSSLQQVDAIRIGDVGLDLDTFRDRLLRKS